MMRRLLLTGAAVLPALPLAPSVAASLASEAVHVVEPGETLNGIANRAGVSPEAVAKANGLKPPYVVRAGQKLEIPRTSGGAATKTATRTIPARAASGRSPEEETVHIVAPGETLGGIAVRARVPRVLIAEANGLQPPYVIKAGQKLQIPRTRRHTVQSGDTGFSISYKYAVPWEQIAVANDVDPQAPVKVGQNLLIPTLLDPSAVEPAALSAPAAAVTAPKARFAWPLSGPIRRNYSTGSNYHDGLDISAPEGTMVRAAAPGTVKFAGKEKEQFGNLVVLDHGGGWYTAYGFLSRITVKQGARVAPGERIGLVGSTGLAKGDELHFEVRKDGKPVDPLDELPKAP